MKTISRSDFRRAIMTGMQAQADRAIKSRGQYNAAPDFTAAQRQALRDMADNAQSFTQSFFEDCPITKIGLANRHQGMAGDYWPFVKSFDDAISAVIGLPDMHAIRTAESRRVEVVD